MEKINLMEVFKMARNYSEEEKQKLLDKYK